MPNLGIFYMSSAFKQSLDMEKLQPWKDWSPTGRHNTQVHPGVAALGENGFQLPGFDSILLEP